MAKVPPKPSGKGMPPEPVNTLGNLDKPEAGNTGTMNFKVSETFKVEFKTYAAQHGKSMNRVLQEAFTLYKAANP
jgi:predicted HicB family RNase H-like nuclease